MVSIIWSDKLLPMEIKTVVIYTHTHTHTHTHYLNISMMSAQGGVCHLLNFSQTLNKL